jgi:hypothetical protein
MIGGIASSKLGFEGHKHVAFGAAYQTGNALSTFTTAAVDTEGYNALSFDLLYTTVIVTPGAGAQVAINIEHADDLAGPYTVATLDADLDNVQATDKRTIDATTVDPNGQQLIRIGVELCKVKRFVRLVIANSAIGAPVAGDLFDQHAIAILSGPREFLKPDQKADLYNIDR